MDTFTAIRLRALQTVMRPGRDYLIRRTLRWYSKTFYTPLREVEELPLEDVFQAYYEEQYAAMSEEELDRERTELLTTEEERYERILAEEAEEAELFEMRRVLAAEERAKKLKATKVEQGKIAEVKPQTQAPIAPVVAPKTELPKELPPGISMTFVSDADFEAELDGFGAMAPPPKQQS